jgi:uncharacterized protein
VYAHREELPEHPPMLAWLRDVLDADATFGIADIVLSGFLRIVTHPHALAPPTPLDTALAFVGAVRDAPNRVDIRPGPRHWDIFIRLCREAGATGNRVPDAYLAALAIESGSEWITTDRGFARFPGLRWRHPLG